MSETRWTVLSEWHNAWLAADPDERLRLRDRIGQDHPGLQDEADALAAASAGLDGFLNTPAFVVAAPMLAEESSPLKPGTTVGPYQVVELIARGGMGDVYRASDLRLGRDVAMKVLTQTDADSQSVHRFVQEARITASLGHPNIVRVFDVGMFQGKPFLVAELLDGETLGARIRRGALAAPDAAHITAQVASGLTEAHQAGLVHRDLKPDNIFLTKSGITKILDFGIAKLASDGIGGEGSQTLSGVLLGTAGYLAPEQVRGGPVDARADLFALGAIAFEMVTGKRAFGGEHTIDTLHAIAHDPPPDLDAFGDAPPPFAAVVIRLLQKDPAERFQSAALLRAALDEMPHAPVGAAAPGWRRGLSRRFRRLAPLALPIAAAALGLVALGFAIGSRSPSESASEIPFVRMTWTLPAGMGLDSPPVVSPDGRRVAFIGVEKGVARLMVWGLHESSPRVIPGTEGAKQPFWSPASDAIGFFARQRLKKVGLTASGPTELAEALDGRGGTWSSSGTIVFGPDLIETALLQVADRGGMATPATRLDSERWDNSHRWPAFLPDDNHFLYFVRSETRARRGVYLGRADKPASPSTQLLRSESEAVYVPGTSRDSGHLLYVAENRLEARPFDAKRMLVTGDARIVATPAGGNTPYHPAMFSASRDVLAYVGSPIAYGARLGSVDRTGDSLRMSEEREVQGWPRLSPDGKWLAKQRVGGVEGNPDIWVEHIELGTRIRVTTSPLIDLMATWSPDGRQLAYISDAYGKSLISIAAADGTGVRRTISCPGVACETTDWSNDGQELIITVHVPGGTDVWAVRTDAAATATPLLAEKFLEFDARLSPDGRWLAYVSNDTGLREVSIRRRDGDRRRIPISSGGGTQPVWQHDDELLFVDLRGRLMRVPIDRGTNGDLTAGIPVALPVPPIGTGHYSTQYDISPDGRRLYFMERHDEWPSPSIHVLLGWRALLK